MARRPVTRARLAALVCLALLLLCATAGRPVGVAAEAGWAVLVVRGEVEYRAPRSASWQRVVPDTPLPPGSEVRTGPRGLVVLEGGDDVVRLGPDTGISLPAPGASVEVRQERGEAHYIVRPEPTRRFEVKTSWLLLAVRGTSFGVATGPSGTSVRVDSGAVEVGAVGSDERVVLGAGERAQVRREQPHRLEVVQANRRNDTKDRAADRPRKRLAGSEVRWPTEPVPGQDDPGPGARTGGLWGWLQVVARRLAEQSVPTSMRSSADRQGDNRGDDDHAGGRDGDSHDSGGGDDDGDDGDDDDQGEDE